MPARLQVVPNRPPDDREQMVRRVRSYTEPEVISCHRCAGTALLQVRINMRLLRGKASGGTKAMVCAMCLSRGETVVLG